MSSDDRYDQIFEHLTHNGRVAFTVAEACKAASISPAYFWKLRAAGQIDTIAYGNRTHRVTAHELARLISHGIPA